MRAPDTVLPTTTTRPPSSLPPGANVARRSSSPLISLLIAATGSSVHSPNSRLSSLSYESAGMSSALHHRLSGSPLFSRSHWATIARARFAMLLGFRRATSSGVFWLVLAGSASAVTPSWIKGSLSRTAHPRRYEGDSEPSLSDILDRGSASGVVECSRDKDSSYGVMPLVSRRVSGVDSVRE